MQQPKVFIGSSRSGLGVAREVKAELGDAAQVTVWNQNTFELGETPIEALERVLSESDFAILVFTPDILALKPNSQEHTPTENVLFELGLFMGHLGRDRTFIVQNFEDEISILSDLRGITLAKFRYNPPDNLRSAVGDACTQIRNRIYELGNRAHKEKELGVLYRLLNACTYPLYPDIQHELLRYVSYRERETFREVREVVDFLEDLFKDYVYPLLKRRELEALRIYFAYYLGDGVKLTGRTDILTYCIDTNLSGSDFHGQFVIGTSNPEFYPDESWRVGRVISGYENGRSTSNCANVFQSGIASYKSDLTETDQRNMNYDTQNEESVYTVPVEWRTQEGNARIGVLAVSSKYPDHIHDRLKVRIQLLGNIIGFLFSLYAVENLNDLDTEAADYSQQNSQPFGCDITQAVFVKRVVGLRRRIAAYYEEYFLRRSIHTFKNNELIVAAVDNAQSK